MSFRFNVVLILLTLVSGCAQPFLRPGNVDVETAQPDGDALFMQTFNAHGGERIDQLRDVSLGIDGQWKSLIKKIQPLVTDFNYRVKSEERLLPAQGVYTALYTGPGGTKKVVRTPDETRVYYNGVESTDSDVVQSSSLTAESFLLFLLGPLALADRATGFTRLEDGHAKGKTWYRIYRELEPGLGESARDEVVLWIDPETRYTWRINITLEGFRSTKGAHVDVTYLDYVQRDGFVLPSRFFERVLAPIGIDAHAWSLTGLDLNRGFGFDEIDGEVYTGEAARAANPL